MQPILDISLNVLTLFGFLILLSFVDLNLTIISLIFGSIFFLIFIFSLRKNLNF